MTTRIKYRMLFKMPARWKKWLAALLLAVAVTGFLYVVPRPLFRTTCSTIIESRDGRLLGARIAPDGQWRFPEPDSIPRKFEQCLLTFEDRHFYRHPGVNPVSLLRAAVQNIKAGRIVSGGSTLTMQVARLARQGKPRNLSSKLVEMVWALNLELRFPKREILKKYVANAPFGGNVVGLEAASWRYYGQPPHLLSWAESATLAVLPNAPSLIFPGKNDSLLLLKRNRLLDKLLRRQLIDSLTWSLSLQEPLPRHFFQLPSDSYHLVERAAAESPGERVKTTVDAVLQERVAALVNRHARQLQANRIFNACALVADLRSGDVLAYAGNVTDFSDDAHGYHVDIIRSPRSSGSILKPFLFAAMTDKGMLAPNQLLADIPTRFGGFTPVNFNRSYDGAVPAAEALARSLNVPAVKMLQQFGVEPFYHFLRKTGMTTLTQPAGHYGLSLILGGAEVTLWDLAGMYASMGRMVRRYGEEDGFYATQPFQPLNWKAGKAPQPETEAAQPELRAASIFLTLKALLEVHRPEEEAGWESFAGARHIAWKTGTSFGFRDGWAVGVTRDAVVAVWTGNADGEGRPGLTGTATAAPLMFEIFGLLPVSDWFAAPVDELTPVVFCRQSGFLPSPYCTDTDTLLVAAGTNPGQCPFHQLIHLDRQGRLRVADGCYPVGEMVHRSWFVLPPAMEYYYRQRHPEYLPLPPVKPGCTETTGMMELIYPREMNRLFIPRQLDGAPGEALFELAHRSPNATVYWYLDQQFLGKTSVFHHFSLRPDPGWHLLTLVDQDGNQLQKRFLVADKEADN